MCLVQRPNSSLTPPPSKRREALTPATRGFSFSEETYCVCCELNCVSPKTG